MTPAFWFCCGMVTAFVGLAVMFVLVGITTGDDNEQL